MNTYTQPKFRTRKPLYFELNFYSRREKPAYPANKKAGRKSSG
ncbi:hypothetical protein [Elizabethkingia ursingii]|nr:hypothetical protein [Elizabethkingia ursingii]